MSQQYHSSAGGGGLDLGFHKAGFNIIWANDINQDACDTHRLWSNATIICNDIHNIDINDIPESQVVIGGFPCQGFSLAGPRKIDDKRNLLYRFFVKVVEKNRPLAFVAENVKGILTLGEGKIIEAILSDFSSKGYTVYPTLVNASDYEVPQDRQRVLMVGFRNDLNISDWKFPAPYPKKKTLLDALKNLPEPKPEEICQAPFSSRFMSRNRRRNWNQQSFTIPAMAKQVPLHPDSPEMEKLGKDLWKFGNGKTRRLSWKEAAAIQTFPENMTFCGDLTSIYRQIGNAVPVRLAEIVAESVRNTLEKAHG